MSLPPVSKHAESKGGWPPQSAPGELMPLPPVPTHAESKGGSPPQSAPEELMPLPPVSMLTECSEALLNFMMWEGNFAPEIR
jgi:hypothetical protein